MDGDRSDNWGVGEADESGAVGDSVCTKGFIACWCAMINILENCGFIFAGDPDAGVVGIDNVELLLSGNTMFGNSNAIGAEKGKGVVCKGPGNGLNGGTDGVPVERPFCGILSGGAPTDWSLLVEENNRGVRHAMSTQGGKGMMYLTN